MKRFDKLLEEEVSSYQGENQELIKQAPALYRLMTRLLDDKDLPSHQSQLVIAAIAYFILPGDIVPEDKYGPLGFVDDIFLCAFVADQIRKETASDEILVRNWDGKNSILSLVKEILNGEDKLIGDKKGTILEYIGYEQLGSGAKANSID
jgi:uncharacterized membrane protein YkvA (DUF1232 family)